MSNLLRIRPTFTSIAAFLRLTSRERLRRFAGFRLLPPFAIAWLAGMRGLLARGALASLDNAGVARRGGGAHGGAARTSFLPLA